MNESQRSEGHQSIAHLSNSREETGGETVCAVPGKVAGWHVQTQDLEASYLVEPELGAIAHHTTEASALRANLTGPGLETQRVSACKSDTRSPMRLEDERAVSVSRRLLLLGR
jgi:hypothetical protein